MRAGIASRSCPFVSSRVASATTPPSAKAFRARLGTSTRPPRASAGDDDAPAPAGDVGPEALAAERHNALRSRAGGMRVKALKRCLGQMGRGGSNFFEKSDVVDAVVDGWEERLCASTRVPLRQIVGMPGNPRAGYVLVTLDLPGDAGFVDFLVDTGATAALISPTLREMLGAHAVDGAAIRGLGSMGETVRQKTTVSDVAVGGVTFGDLNCVVTDLSATGLPSVVGGMLGLEFLERFETEFDFANKTLAFHAPGTIACGAVDVDDLVEIPLKTHPTGLKLVRCSLNAGAPFDAIVDAGSFFSVVNWMAAASGGVAPDSVGVEASAMTAVGVDGRTMPMSTAAFDLEVLGADGKDSASARNGLASTYKGQCCVGDLPAFAALGAETSAFMSMGLDVLGRGRTVLDVRNDRLYLTPGDAADGGYPEAS